MKLWFGIFGLMLTSSLIQGSTDIQMQRVPTSLATGQADVSKADPLEAPPAEITEIRALVIPLAPPAPKTPASPDSEPISQVNSAELEATEQQRVAYLQRLINAVRSLPAMERKRLEKDSESVFGGVCRSSDPTLALSCSFESAARICANSSKQSACLIMLDALVVERLNANRFISARERYEMMSRGDDHRQRMAEALSYRYGSLVAAFSLNKAAACKASDYQCFSKGIDSYCQAQAQKGHLSYQSCAALIALFIGRHN